MHRVSVFDDPRSGGVAGAARILDTRDEAENQMHALRRHGGLEVPAPVALVVFDVRVEGNHRGVVGPVRSAVASGGDRWRKRTSLAIS